MKKEARHVAVMKEKRKLRRKSMNSKLNVTLETPVRLCRKLRRFCSDHVATKRAVNSSTSLFIVFDQLCAECVKV